MKTKALIMCEGTCEVALLDVLIERNLLIFKKQKSYIYEYFNSLSNSQLIHIVKDNEIKRKGTHLKEEISLYDLLKS